MATPRGAPREQSAAVGGGSEAVTELEQRQPIFDALGAKAVVGASAEARDVKRQVADLVTIHLESELAALAPVGDVREGSPLTEVEAQLALGARRIECEGAWDG